MKNNKKLFIIIGSVVLFLLLVIGIYFMFFNGSNTNKTTVGTKNSVDDKIDAPASSTEELVKEMKIIETETVTEDEIVFSDDIKLEENQKVAVWIYSKPKFLGYFEVLFENGTKKIVGLKQALENISIESGKHNIAITTEKGDPIGYIDINIKENGKLSNSLQQEEIIVEETTTQTTTTKTELKTSAKKITETEIIKYSSTKQNEVNMKKGTTSVIQAGSNGVKEITYEVIYDSNGKELSRKKLSEKITKEVVNEIVKVGTSDFNINTDTTNGWMSGVACPESKTYTASYDGVFHCNDEAYEDLEQFGATIMAGKIIVTRVGETKLSKAIIATPVNDYVFVGTYNGQKYYFDNRMGSGEQGTLTLEFCNEYGLSCGAW